jgi:hypothetical protein
MVHFEGKNPREKKAIAISKMENKYFIKKGF